MFESLYIAATGMRAGQESITTISNNLANLNTVGFKKSRASFDDIFYRDTAGVDASKTFAGNHSQVGMGTSIAEVQKIFDKGDLKATSNALDVAINGKGFLEVNLPNDEHAYTRDGALQVGTDGYLQTKDGYKLSAMIAVPPDAASIKISESGVVTAAIADTNEMLEIGQIEVSDFVNESDLKALGNGLYIPTETTGSVAYSLPGENSTGKLQQGFLESSNVEMVSELMDLVVAQQMFSVNSQVIKASDHLMQLVNNLRQ